MPERPLLILPTPGQPSPRRKRGGGGGKFHHPSLERQVERMSPRFERLQRAFEEKRTRLQMEARELIPEEVVVLETIGTVENFIRAVEKVPGMEWLAEVEGEEIPPDDDFFALADSGEPRPNKALRARIFMVFVDQEALRQMLSLWERWRSGQKLDDGLAKWNQLFQQLHDVRHWGVLDRLQETGVLDDWRERVEHGEEVVPCEIELWPRQAAGQRQTARNQVSELVEALGGQIVTESNIEDIAYHALLVRLPVAEIRPLLESIDRQIRLVQCEQIQFFRASGQMSSSLPDFVQAQDEQELPDVEAVGRPVVALLDGLPLQEHRRLTGRLIVDDPDGFESDYPASTRRHGTAMASLILHGDMAQQDEVFPRPLYVRPILQQDSRDWVNQAETVPERTLVVDLVHRAVRRLFDMEGDEPAVAPEVAVINLSIGVRDRPFDHMMSPLARLLDWLSWRYQVLFVVSAGNHVGAIDYSALPQTDPSLFDGVQERVIRSVAADARHRRLLSPAEAVNVLTVASAHHDASKGPLPPGWIDPYTADGLPSPINAQGMGHRRGIKPDILAPGGRVAVRDTSVNGDHREGFDIYDQSGAPGQLVASPGRVPGERDGVRYSRGTSNATALVSRACGFLYNVTEELRHEPGGEIIDSLPRAVWLKALVAHGADWGEAGTVLTNILKDKNNSRQFKEYVTRLLGYGTVDADRVRECTAQRVTAIGGGTLRRDESHVHRFPLPPSLSGERGHRRLTITLGWLSPVNPRHQAWRRGHLWFSPPMDALRVRRRQADWQAVQRGTLQHEILEGDEAGVFVAGANLEIQVSCRADAGTLEAEVPYALVTTLEVATGLDIDIYDEVRTILHATRVRAQSEA